MAKDVKFRLNRRAFQRQILMGEGVDMASALERALPDAEAETTVSNNARGGGRMRRRLYGSMRDEVGSGSLSRKLGS